MKAELTSKFEEDRYEGEADAVFRFCLVRVSNREQAMDITQETFLRLWQSLQVEEILNNKAFLFTVAHRLIIDWYRKKKSVSLEGIMNREGGTQYNPPDESTIGNVELGAEGRFLISKINELPPTFRDPVYLRFVEGLAPGEIGEVLNISANAVSVRVNRGLAELRRVAGYNND